jgi:hemerythrin superfamily protein
MEVFMQIYDYLKKDHQEVRALLTELVSLAEDDDYREIVIDHIAAALIPHSRAEESVFYNTIRAVDADSGKVMHGFREHMEAEGLLRVLQAKDRASMNWKETAKKLEAALEHHVQEEETEIFAQAKVILTDEEAESIGEAFNALKGKISDEGSIAQAFDLIKNLMPPRLMNKLTRDSHR